MPFLPFGAPLILRATHPCPSLERARVHKSTKIHQIPPSDRRLLEPSLARSHDLFLTITPAHHSPKRFLLPLPLMPGIRSQPVPTTPFLSRPKPSIPLIHIWHRSSCSRPLPVISSQLRCHCLGAGRATGEVAFAACPRRMISEHLHLKIPAPDKFSITNLLCLSSQRRDQRLNSGIRAAGRFWVIPTLGVIVAGNREAVSGAHITHGTVKLSTWLTILREELGGNNNRNIICRWPKWRW